MAISEKSYRRISVSVICHSGFPILNKKSILSGLRFCEDYTFDFYDGSLCGMAREMGLKVGTAPILATHMSCGQGMMEHKEEYLESQRRFISTWFC